MFTLGPLIFEKLPRCPQVKNLRKSHSMVLGGGVEGATPKGDEDAEPWPGMVGDQRSIKAPR